MPEDTPVLDLLAGMTALSLEATTLDDRDVMLARIAALVASDAPPIAYSFNLEAAGGIVTGEEIRGVVAAIAPIVGTARVTTALGNVMKAVAFEELAELDAEATA